jgi:hypothetical protein
VLRLTIPAFDRATQIGGPLAKFDIQKAVRRITDAERPTHERAIELFTLLVAIHAGKSQANVTSHAAFDNETLVISVPRSVLRQARLLAAMKFLDQIESQWQIDNPARKPFLTRIATIEEFRTIYDNVIVKQGGWNKIRFLGDVRELERQINDWKRRARDVARIVEFSARFRENKAKPRHLGGVTMAFDIVSSKAGQRYFGTRTKRSQLQVAWKHFRCQAPFFYLLYTQKYQYFLKMIAGKNFASKWAVRANDRAKLLEFFAAYNAVARQLMPRNYRYSELELPSDTPEPKIDFEPFPETDKKAREVLREIADYRA